MTSHHDTIPMSLKPEQLASILKLRAVGWSQNEIAESIGISQQVVAYNLKKMKEKSKKYGPNKFFSTTLFEGLTAEAEPHQMERIGVFMTLYNQLNED
jgi:transcriptional regulator|tara:strand:+ start:219 stop:512 length:294 start_codon:yes stop_codon:yes gene_type:complete